MEETSEHSVSFVLTSTVIAVSGLNQLSLVQELISPRLALMEGACLGIDSSEWQ